ncbi:unnamed protein product [marine sediment metagenome]|uniref:Uncharacterized protein n=1 Tax=marine sediment metagenome TaxID=412755 RepID=X1JGT7_9ZZZZ
MNNPLGLSKTKLNEIFSDVNILYRDNIEEVIKEYVLQGLKRTFEKAMKAEVLGYLKAKRYERKKVRIDFRNGYRHRNLLTIFHHRISLVDKMLNTLIVWLSQEHS